MAIQISSRLITALLLLTLPGFSQVTISGGASVGGGTLMCVPSSAAPVFSPTPGTYSSTQTVTMTCPSGKTGFYRTDGGLVTIASPKYTSPIAVSSSETFVGICATLGAYQANTQAASTAFACGTALGGTWSPWTCEVDGGVGTINPTNLTATFPGGSSPSVETITTPATSGSSVQALFKQQFGGSVDPIAPTCDACTEQVKDIKFTVIGTGLENQEFDSPQYDPTHGNTDRQNGTQCQGSSGKIEVDSGNAGGWTVTTAPCSTWTNGTTHEEVNRVDHDLTGSCPGGNGCALYKYIWIDGTNYPLLGNYSNTQGYINASGAAWGWQFQPDMKPTTGTAATGGWSIASATVALGFGDESAQTVAAYTISAPAFSVTPSSIAEGSVLAGTTAYFTTATVTNTGVGNLTFSGIGFTGTNSSDFAVTSGFSPSVNPVGGNTLPLCSTASPVAPSASCIVPIDFVPGASGSRTASLSFTDNASGSPHTVALTGTGTAASGTALPACGSLLSASTTYFANSDITCSGSGFGLNGKNITVNLNGHTLTVCNSPATTGTSCWAFYAADSGDTSFTASTCSLSGASHPCGFGTTPTTAASGNDIIENGTIVIAGGSSFNAATAEAGSAAFYVGNAATPSSNQIHDVAVTIPANCISCQVYSGFGGSTSTFNGVGDKVYHNTVNDNSMAVSSRCAYQGAAFVFYNNRGTANPGPVFYENTINHTPQDGVAEGVDYGSVFGNTIQVGNPTGTSAGTSSTCSGIGTASTGTQSANDFAIGLYGGHSSAVNNTINNLEGRGIDVTESGSGGSTTNTSTSSGNSITTTDLPNYVEYSGCQLGGGYAERLNNFGDTSATNYSIIGENISATAKACNGTGMSVSSNSSTTNFLQGLNVTERLLSGHGTVNAIGIAHASSQYGNVANLTDTGSTYSADTMDVDLFTEAGYSGPYTCVNCTFDKPATATAGVCGPAGGSTPETSWVFVSTCFPGIAAATVGPAYFVNPTFTGGALASNNDFTIASAHMTSGTSSSYFIQYTYQVTVTGAVSGSPIVGATVTATDTHSGLECTATTNSSGVAVCNGSTALAAANASLNNTKYSFTAPSAPVTTTYNPFAFQITKTGCTTNSYSESITGATVETKTLSGC